MAEIILGGRYIIENEIGSGGMAIVYKAHDNLLNRTVAIKVLRPEFKQDEEFIKRFDTEAKASAGLNHPNIVGVYDVGIHEGLHYIVMEYIDGITLKELISQKGALSWDQALKYASKICSALEHAHDRKVIHRDIKPHNIMVTNEGTVKVMDFGIARAASSSTMTIGSKVLGSAHYLSPEQARGGFTDERSDIYSLGICLYEMVTGKLPFDADTTIAVAMQHLQQEPKPPCSVKENIPSSVEYIILKAIRKEQNQRYYSASAMGSDIIMALEDPLTEFSDEEEGIYYSTKQNESYEKNELKVKKGKENKRLFVGICSALVIFIAFLTTMIVLNRGEEVKAPNIKGLTLEQAYEKVSEIDEEIQIRVRKEEYSTKEERNKIIEQNPEEGMKISDLKEIEVVIGIGEESFEVEKFVGMQKDEAKKAAEDLGLMVTLKDETDDDMNEKYEIDTITNQSIKEGNSASYEDEIILYVSQGSESVRPKMIKVIGLTEAEAEDALKEAGFINIEFIPKESDIEAGRVIAQSVSEGVRINPDKYIKITVSSGISDKNKKAILSFTLPSEPDTVKVKIIRKDNGESVYSRQHKAGENVRVEVKVSENKVYEIYLNDAFWAEKSVSNQ